MFFTIENGILEVVMIHQLCIGIKVAHHFIRKEILSCGDLDRGWHLCGVFGGSSL
jgi:hypothetical protein